MKPFVLLLTLITMYIPGFGNPDQDSVQQIWNNPDLPDSIRLQALDQKALDYIYAKPDSGIYFAQLTYELSEQADRPDFMVTALYRQGVAYYVKRDYRTALELSEQCLALAEEHQNKKRISHALILAAAVSQERGDYRKTIDYYLRSLQLAELEGDEKLVAILHINIGLVYSLQGNPEKAIAYLSIAQKYFRELGGHQKEVGEIFGHIGKAWLSLQDYPKALESYQQGYDTLNSINSERRMADMLWGMGESYRGLSSFQRALEAHQQGLRLFQKVEDPYGVAISNLGIGKTEQAMGKYATAVAWCKKALTATTTLQNLAEQKEACDCLYQSYKAMGRYQDALLYHEKKSLLLDSLQLQATDKKLQEMEFERVLFADSLQHSKELEILDLEIGKQKAEISRQRIGLASVAGGLILTGLLAFLIYRGKRRSEALTEEMRQKNEIISLQAQELEHSNHQLADSLEHLQQTQQQLILQEKMASLGQVTMGIAHEIKNPLNFVNNYAEVSVELAGELEEEFVRLQDTIAEEERKGMLEIIQDLRENAAVIQKNGQRADSIVSSMRNHANDNRGQRTEVAINDLIKSQVDLACYGYSSQEPSTSIQFEYDLAPDLPLISLNSQEIARVIINLVSNACYALHQKSQQAASGYKPTLKIQSQKIADSIEIRIRDNGTGISQENLSKIFQPFFTTKPTGQGNTGLGLSICYDIVVQGHQGRLTVESEKGKYCEFVISLPTVLTKNTEEQKALASG